jgi:hypothetical protein
MRFTLLLWERSAALNLTQLAMAALSSEMHIGPNDEQASPSKLFTELAPGGKLTISPVTPGLVDALILAGFVDVSSDASTSVVAFKPSYALGGAPIKLRKRTVPASAPVPAPESSALAGVVFDDPAKRTWAALAAGDAAGAAAPAVVDENALLGNDDFNRPTAPAGDAAGCAPKRKACANCSCGCVIRSFLHAARHRGITPLPHYLFVITQQSKGARRSCA